MGIVDVIVVFAWIIWSIAFWDYHLRAIGFFK